MTQGFNDPILFFPQHLRLLPVFCVKVFAEPVAVFINRGLVFSCPPNFYPSANRGAIAQGSKEEVGVGVMLYHFHDFELDERLYQLRRGGARSGAEINEGCVLNNEIEAYGEVELQACREHAIVGAWRISR